MSERPATWGLLAAFDDDEGLAEAVRRLRAEGFTRVDAYAPHEIPAAIEALGIRHSRVSLLTLLGGAAGGMLGFALQVWCAVFGYPWNVGGRPAFSWPSFVPITFELTILGAAFAATFGMLAVNGLPRLHHPLFGAPGFGLARSSCRFVTVESRDPRFDATLVRRLCTESGATEVSEVAW